jgi:hypothetical protein
MSEPREDVLNKLDALLKKHAPSEPEIPVLTDLVEQPLIDLEAIPVLTDEIALDLNPVAAEAIAPQAAAPEAPIDLDLVHESFLKAAAPQSAHGPAAPEAESVLARLEAVEAEVQAEIEGRIAQTQAMPSAPPSIEIPQQAQYIPLPAAPPPTPVPAATPQPETEPSAVGAPITIAAPTQLPEETVLQIASLIEADVARMIKNNLHQTLAEELPGMLNSALDKALSSMLEQFMVHMEEVVRSAIADELKKQLAPFKRPASGNKP